MRENPIINTLAWFDCLRASGQVPPGIEHTPIQIFSHLSQVIIFLRERGFFDDSQAMLVLDWDKTCRQQPKSNLWKLRFGEITEEEMHLLEQLKEELSRVLIISNQTKFTAAIPALFAFLNSYKTYFQAVKDLGIPHVEADGLGIPGLMRPFKYSKNAVSKTLQAIENPVSQLGFVTDTGSDLEFADLLAASLRVQNPDLRMLTFLLTPHPPIPDDEAEFIPGLRFA